MTIKQLGGVFGRNPTFNNVTIEGTLTFDGDIDINSDLTIEDNLYVLGSVGIGTISADTLLELSKQNNTGNTGVPTLRFTDTDTSSAAGQKSGQIEFKTSDATPGPVGVHSFINGQTENTSGLGALVFGTGQSGSASESMRIDSSGHAIIPAGVTLGTATGVYDAAKTLDDYEKGVWIPVISTSTPPTTPFGQYNDGASYTKIGNVVFLYAMFRTNGVTIAGAAGDVIITGLPFTPSSSVSGGGLTVLQTSSWVTGPRAGYARTTNDIVLTYTPTATDEISPLPYTALTTGAGLNNLIHIMVVYRTDS